MKLFNSIVGSFAAGCMIFMLSGLLAYYEHGAATFDAMVTRYDDYVYAIFAVALVAGGLGYWIYDLHIAYTWKVLIHYGSTFVAVMLFSIWLDIITLNWGQIIGYGITVTIIFIVNWLVNYMNAKREAEELNALLQRGNNIK